MKYDVLKKSEFQFKEYSIIPIREIDMENIRLWRNSQMAVLRQKKELTRQDQENYFRQIIEPLFTNKEPGQLLFSFLKNGVLIGYGGLVNITWLDKRAEMSFLVDPQIASEKEQYMKSMSAFIALVKELVFGEMKFNRLFTETYSFRTFHISVLEENGFVEEGRMREHVFESGKYVDSILHSILNNEYVKS